MARVGSPGPTQIGSHALSRLNDQLLALASIQVKLQGSPADPRNEDFVTLASQVLTPDQNALYAQSNASQKESNDLVQRALAAAKQQYGDIKSWHVNGP